MAQQLITDLDSFREQAFEELGGFGIAFQPEPDGETFLVPHPLFLEEEQNIAMKSAVTNVDIAQVLLNTEKDPDRHARFISVGGRSGDILLAWRQMTQHMNDPK